MSTLHCRAVLQLQKELHKIQSLPIKDVTITTYHDDAFQWTVNLSGPPDTEWSVGIFVVKILFGDGFNTDPPEIFFLTIPYHPNIHAESGKVCMKLLSEWSQQCSMREVLVGLQTLLAVPDLNWIVNQDAAQEFTETPHIYSKNVTQCVKASLNIYGQSPVGDYRPVLQKESGSTIQSVSSVNIVNDHVDNKTHAKNVTKLSFEDYHNSWTKLATSQPRSSSSKQPIIDLMRVTPSQPGNDKYERYENEIGVEIERQLKEHNSLMYGKFPREKEKHAERMRELKATKVQLLKDLHYNKRRQNDMHIRLPDSPAGGHDDPDYLMSSNQMEEQEEQDLLNWVTSLPD